MRYAIIDAATNLVTNLISLPDDYRADAANAWQCPNGFYIIASASASIGEAFNVQTERFTTPASSRIIQLSADSAAAIEIDSANNITQIQNDA